MFSCQVEAEILTKDRPLKVSEFANLDGGASEARAMRGANRLRSIIGEKVAVTHTYTRSEELLSAGVIQVKFITCT
jgi:hypothetical protein